MLFCVWFCTCSYPQTRTLLLCACGYPHTRTLVLCACGYPHTRTLVLCACGYTHTRSVLCAFGYPYTRTQSPTHLTVSVPHILGSVSLCVLLVTQSRETDALVRIVQSESAAVGTERWTWWVLTSSRLCLAFFMLNFSSFSPYLYR